MKKSTWIILSTIFFLIGLSYFLFANKMIVGKEKVICGSFVDAPCYRYKCETGQIKELIGGNPSCSDGSSVINLGKVEN